jgi:mRNA-degrading endonuclease RelE of RelBE toxin-antitoxin system
VRRRLIPGEDAYLWARYRIGRLARAAPGRSLDPTIYTGCVGLASLDFGAPVAHTSLVVIVETKAFSSRVDDLLTAEEYRLLQLELVQDPSVGDTIPGTGGLRKLRWRAGGRGKRGGARVIYFWHAASEVILMLLVYAKSERTDLTVAQREALRRIVETEYP